MHYCLSAPETLTFKPAGFLQMQCQGQSFIRALLCANENAEWLDFSVWGGVGVLDLYPLSFALGPSVNERNMRLVTSAFCVGQCQRILLSISIFGVGERLCLEALFVWVGNHRVFVYTASGGKKWENTSVDSNAVMVSDHSAFSCRWRYSSC